MVILRCGLAAGQAGRCHPRGGSRGHQRRIMLSSIYQSAAGLKVSPVVESWTTRTSESGPP